MCGAGRGREVRWALASVHVYDKSNAKRKCVRVYVCVYVCAFITLVTTQRFNSNCGGNFSCRGRRRRAGETRLNGLALSHGK